METSEVFKILGSPETFFHLVKGILPESLFSAQVPGVACKSHSQFMSTLGDQDSPAGHLEMQVGPDRPGWESHGSERAASVCTQPFLTPRNASWIFNLEVEGPTSCSNPSSQDPKCFSLTAQEITTLVTSQADGDSIISVSLVGEHTVP